MDNKIFQINSRLLGSRRERKIEVCRIKKIGSFKGEILWDYLDIIDKLLETPCYIMDFLPKQVPMNCGGQFFEVETYLLNHYDCCGLRDRFVGVILKAMCYYPVSVQWGKWIEQPTPEQVTKIIDTILENHSGDVNILFTSKDVLLQFGWDCLNISIYNPDEEMCMLFEKIAASEGLFWRKSE